MQYSLTKVTRPTLGTQCQWANTRVLHTRMPFLFSLLHRLVDLLHCDFTCLLSEEIIHQHKGFKVVLPPFHCTKAKRWHLTYLLKPESFKCLQIWKMFHGIQKICRSPSITGFPGSMDIRDAYLHVTIFPVVLRLPPICYRNTTLTIFSHTVWSVFLNQQVRKSISTPASNATIPGYSHCEYLYDLLLREQSTEILTMWGWQSWLIGS